jgi:RNA polymerase sigma-70 factor (ECF subfamily)
LNDDDPDAELLARVGRGEPRAVREMVERKLGRLLSLAERMLGRRVEAEEVAQEVFVRVWKQAPHWQPGRARFDTWLHRVALNLCYDRLRRRREEAPDNESDEVAPIPPKRPTSCSRPSNAAGASPARLAELPQRQREALVLQYYQELSNGEAAELMGIGIEALESLLVRARRSLRARLAGEPRRNDDA